METIIIHPPDAATASKIKDYLKQMKVNFEAGKVAEDDGPYDPDFVKMILDARNEKGGKEIDPNNLWESLESS